MNPPKFIFGLIFISTLISCGSSKFDRNEAQKLVIQAFNLPHSEGKDFNCGITYCSNFFEQLKGEFQLYQQGYRQVSSSNDEEGTNCMYDIQFTDKATPFVISTREKGNKTIYKMKVSEINFGEVKSFRQINEKEYELEFTLRRTSLTPIGEAYNQYVWTDSRYVLRESDFNNMKITFMKYDTGWQISTSDKEWIGKLLSQL